MYKLLSACDVHMTRGTISLSLEQVAPTFFWDGSVCVAIVNIRVSCLNVLTTDLTHHSYVNTI
jgi:hypothetical protein